MKPSDPLVKRQGNFSLHLFRGLCVTAVLGSSAYGYDSDGDGADDFVDSKPCDAAVSGVQFFPAENELATFLFEDSWPAQGDLDFNDTVVGIGSQAFLTSSGAVAELDVLVQLRAAGGTYRNSLRISLGALPRGVTAQAVLSNGAGPELALAPDANELELVYTLVPDIHVAFADRQTAIINADPTRPHVVGPTFLLRVVFSSAVGLNPAKMPFDIHLARMNDPTHQIHQPEYMGTTSMNTALFGTIDDGSTASRAFVDRDGLPFVLSIPESTYWSVEGQGIEQLFPTIVPWAQAGAGNNAYSNFYTASLSNQLRSYQLNAGQPVPTSKVSSLSWRQTDRGCTPEVAWQNYLGVHEVNKGLIKTDPRFLWEHGASSIQVLNGDGYLEFQAGPGDTYRMVGLSHGDSDGSDVDIDFAYHFSATETLAVRGPTTADQSVSLYRSSDILRIEARGDEVRFYQNGILRSVAPGPISWPLRVDTSIYTPDSQINPVRLLACTDPRASCTPPSAWDQPIGVAHDPSSLSKVGGRYAWGAGAASKATIACSHGYVETVVSQTDTARMFGLGYNDTGPGYQDIEWAYYLRDNGSLEIWEGGTPVASLGSYTQGERLAVAVRPGGFVDYQRNGTTVRTSAVTAPAAARLTLDTSFLTLGGSLTGLRVVSQQVPAQPNGVCWTNLVGTAPDIDSTLVHAGQAGGWVHGGSSVETIVGDGFLETTVIETDTYRMIGLSYDDLDATDADLDYSFHLGATATLAVRGIGTVDTSVSLYQPGDVLRVERQGDQILFLQNGVLRDAATAPSTLPLRVDTSLFDLGSTLAQVRLTDCGPSDPCTELAGWSRPIGVAYTTNALTKDGGRNGPWNAGAASQQTIDCRDGYVQTVVSERNTSRFFGLGANDSSQSYEDVDWAFYLRADGNLNIWENGAPVVSLGAYYSNQVLRVAVSPNGTVEYLINGAVVHQSRNLAQVGVPLHLDTSFSTLGSTLQQLDVVDFCGP